MSWTEQEYEAYLKRRGHLPTLTPPTPLWDTLLARPSLRQRREQRFLADVMAAATVHGFLTYHTYDSRRSAAGFPDCVFVRAARRGRTGRVIFAELKSATGKLAAAQQRWLDLLAHSVPGVEAYCWRPADFDAVLAILARR